MKKRPHFLNEVFLYLEKRKGIAILWKKVQCLYLLC